MAARIVDFLQPVNKIIASFFREFDRKYNLIVVVWVSSKIGVEQRQRLAGARGAYCGELEDVSWSPMRTIESGLTLPGESDAGKSPQ